MNAPRDIPSPGKYRVRNSRGIFQGILVIEVDPAPTHASSPVSSPLSQYAWHMPHTTGGPSGGLVSNTPAGSKQSVVLVRWQGQKNRWEATADDLWRLGIAERIG
jgi:hypothetical protein